MKFLSVCSGIEAASIAWEPLGWQSLAFSEIDKFPSAVLAHHWPDVPNLGDMTNHGQWPDTLRPDLIVGGTPCQAFSVAGLRKGLADPRGNLTLTFLSILAQYRPKWMAWENVPGVLSDSTGAFGALLGGLAKLGYGFAYRILDAQHFGVPQRRRRVFVVGYFGDWRPPAAVLFERESLSGNSPPRRETGEGIAAGFECGPAGSRFIDTAPTLDTRCKDGPIRNQLGAEVISPSVTSKWAKGSGGPAGDECQNLIAHTLKAEEFDAGKDATGPRTPIIPIACGIDGSPDTGHCLRSEPSKADKPSSTTYAVRRLTPHECERLQGFPDDHTLIPWRGKPAENCPDGPRYKALGNSMAVPVMAWIGQRIETISKLLP